MKITGTRDHIEFDFENGYVAVAEGELLTNNRFVVYTNTLTKWDPPHNKEKFCNDDIQRIINEIETKITANTMQIIFE